MQGSVTQKFFQGVAGGVGPRIILPALPIAPRELEPLAEIGALFVLDRFRPSLPALVRRAAVVVHAIEADVQIRPALGTTFTAARLEGRSPKPAALVAMACHDRDLIGVGGE